METTAIDINASAPVGPVSQTKIPDWLTQTPEEHGYNLVMFESNDAEAQSVKLTRVEYIRLKAVLAMTRGLPAPPDDEAETAPAEAKRGRPEVKPQSSLDQIKADLADDIAGEIKSHAERGIGGIDQSTILGDLYMLKDIVGGWGGADDSSDNYPDETPLIAAFRQRLHL